MRKLKVIIHIGTEKTGTTALQSALYNNKHNLIKAGFLYTHGKSLINARQVAAACLEQDAPDEYLKKIGISSLSDRTRFTHNVIKDLYNEVSTAPNHVHSLIISSEHFHSRLRTSRSIQTLKSYLDPIASSFIVVCYLRRQVDMVTSLYSTILKGGKTDFLPDFSKRMLNPSSHYVNYDILLSKWADVFGPDSINARLFNRSNMIGGSVIPDFLSTIGAPEDILKLPPEQNNESLSPLGQCLMREINTAMNGREETASKEIKRVRHIISQSFSGKGMQLRPQRALRLQQLFVESNESVRKRWFPEVPQLFDERFDQHGAWRPSDEQITSIRKFVLHLLKKEKGPNFKSTYGDCIYAIRQSARLERNGNLKEAINILQSAALH